MTLAMAVARSEIVTVEPANAGAATASSGTNVWSAKHSGAAWLPRNYEFSWLAGLGVVGVLVGCCRVGVRAPISARSALVSTPVEPF